MEVLCAFHLQFRFKVFVMCNESFRVAFIFFTASSALFFFLSALIRHILFARLRMIFHIKIFAVFFLTFCSAVFQSSVCRLFFKNIAGENVKCWSKKILHSLCVKIKIVKWLLFESNIAKSQQWFIQFIPTTFIIISLFTLTVSFMTFFRVWTLN